MNYVYMKKYTIFFFVILLLIFSSISSLSLESKLTSDTKNIYGNIQRIYYEDDSHKQMPSTSANYYAILVGIGNYPGYHGDLPFSRNEVRRFKETLLTSSNWDESNIQLLIDEQATNKGILQAFEWYNGNASENDVLVFYFAGHGTDGKEHQYILSHDDAISDEQLDGYLETLKGTIIVIIDACHSGGFIDELAQRDRIILTACRENEKTYQVAELRSGIFGYFLNVSLEKITKTAESTYRLTWIFSIIYSIKLSHGSNENYVIHPQFYDGTFLRTKIITDRKIDFHQQPILQAIQTKIKNIQVWNM